MQTDPAKNDTGTKTSMLKKIIMQTGLAKNDTGTKTSTFTLKTPDTQSIKSIKIPSTRRMYFLVVIMVILTCIVFTVYMLLTHFFKETAKRTTQCPTQAKSFIFTKDELTALQQEELDNIKYLHVCKEKEKDHLQFNTCLYSFKLKDDITRYQYHRMSKDKRKVDSTLKYVGVDYDGIENGEDVAPPCENMDDLPECTAEFINQIPDGYASNCCTHKTHIFSNVYNLFSKKLFSKTKWEGPLAQYKQLDEERCAAPCTNSELKIRGVYSSDFARST